jgi:hypothetical protein
MILTWYRPVGFLGKRVKERTGTSYEDDGPARGVLFQELLPEWLGLSSLGGRGSSTRSRRFDGREAAGLLMVQPRISAGAAQ